MKWKYLLGEGALASLPLPATFVAAEFAPREADRRAAWELHVELVTRIVTQPLPAGQGVEASALASLHALFAISRDIMKRHGREAEAFARVNVAVLNHLLRPFLARWHPLFAAEAMPDDATRAAFRAALDALLPAMRDYARLLAAMADVAPLDAADEHG